jgi:hypothetical protein
LYRLIWMGDVDLANNIAKTSTEIHCLKTNLRNFGCRAAGQPPELPLLRSTRFTFSVAALKPQPPDLSLSISTKRHPFVHVI